MIVNIRVVQEHLGRNTTYVQAGAAKIAVFFDHDRLESKFPGANGCYIAARTATDDRNIVLSHTALLPQASGPRATNTSPGDANHLWRSIERNIHLPISGPCRSPSHA